MVVRRLVVLQLTQCLCPHVVLEVIHLLVAAFLLVGILFFFFFLSIDLLFFVDVFVLRGFHVELQRVLVDKADVTDR